MRRLVRALTPLAAVLCAMTMITGSGTAYAAGSVEAAVNGRGTISPGLTTVPTFQTAVSFSGTATGGGWSTNPSPGTAAFTGVTLSFSGASTVAETSVSGSGSGTVTISGGTGVVVGGGAGTTPVTNATVEGGGVVDYSRVGAVVVVTAQAGFHVTVKSGFCPSFFCLSIRFGAAPNGLGTFVFAPDQVNGAPVTSYSLAGDSVGAAT